MEKVNKTQVSKTVFGGFNLNVQVDTISKQNGHKRLAVYIDNEILFYASGSLNLTILQHIALAELCLLELTIKFENMICHTLATFLAVYYMTTKPNYMKSDTVIYFQQS